MTDYADLKRVCDVITAVCGLILLSPLLLILALIIRVCLGSPVLFSQERITEGQRSFNLLKFRTMLVPDRATRLVSDCDRMTRLGRFLRSTSLDELPSLVNVLVGDISVIGPRPLPPHYLPYYSTEQSRRHDVRGGLTGFAQISGRNALDWDEKFAFDVEYVDKCSLGLDVRILLSTVSTVLSRKGVTKRDETTCDSFGGSLQSDLVRFVPLAVTSDEFVWKVFSSNVHGLRCRVRRTAPAVRQIFLDERAGASPQVRAEIVRLLVNRARGSDGAVAVVEEPQDSGLRQAFVDAGFQMFDSQQRLLRLELWPQGLPPWIGEPEESPSESKPQNGTHLSTKDAL